MGAVASLVELFLTKYKKEEEILWRAEEDCQMFSWTSKNIRNDVSHQFHTWIKLEKRIPVCLALFAPLLSFPSTPE